MDYSLPGSSLHGIFQARTLEWIAMPFSRGSSWSTEQTSISYLTSLALAGGFFTTSATWETPGRRATSFLNNHNDFSVESQLLLRTSLSEYILQCEVSDSIRTWNSLTEKNQLESCIVQTRYWIFSFTVSLQKRLKKKNKLKMVQIEGTILNWPKVMVWVKTKKENKQTMWKDLGCDYFHGITVYFTKYQHEVWKSNILSNWEEMFRKAGQFFPPWRTVS